MKQRRVLITIIVFVIVACISPFLLTMYGAERFNYTQTGQIGDTIGGLTAPVIGILNAVLLYWTLIIQGEQIRQDRLRPDIDKRLDRIRISIKSLAIKIEPVVDVPGNEIVGMRRGMDALTTILE